MNSTASYENEQEARYRALARKRRRERASQGDRLPELLPHQQPPDGSWRGWLLMAGRGAGKTYAGARWLYEQHTHCPYLRIIAPTYADARDVGVEGSSGILAIARPHIEAWNRSLGEVIFRNGARCKLFSADEPDRLRGPQSGADWYDELAAWRYGEETLDMALMGLRIGNDPRYVVTTTPRPAPVVRRLLADPTVITTRASTFDNTHLPDAFKQVILNRYAGTRLGRQELDAELLEDVEGALWKRGMIEGYRVPSAPPFLVRIIVGIDPSATATGDEAGIVVAGLGANGHGYILEDRSKQGSPTEWASSAVTAYHHHKADRLIAETNNGGEMVKLTIRTVPDGKSVAYKGIHASRGKYTRAEPIASLYEQGKVHHVGAFPQLEDELCNWTPGDDSPNRLDALVWALTELMLKRASDDDDASDGGSYSYRSI